jgi:hypothetical protein
MRRRESATKRFGIGEWYGKSFVRLTPAEREFFAKIQQLPKKERPPQICPFQSAQPKTVHCKKEGGVCSLRLYEKSSETGEVKVAPDKRGQLRTTCPNRFEQAGTIYRWVGEVILNCARPLILGEIGFLERESADADEPGAEPSRDEVGRIDKVLVVPGSNPLAWCTLEVQAVYFQGDNMKTDFHDISKHTADAMPFPEGRRRPDYRSSGPKRLMPQLQIKVPSLRRWGKKMAVVVDQSFFAAMGRMETVKHVSNCDVAWFVVKYDDSEGDAKLVPDAVHLTTLERSVEGLTAGAPISSEAFEQRILAKMPRQRPPSPVEVPPD